jgi:ATP-binding cassette, subfamily B, bacterial PglK
MKNFIKIFNRSQKISTIKLIILMLLTTGLEILSLNLIFIIIKYFSNPSELASNKFFSFIKDFDISSDFILILFSIFFLLFLLKNFSIIIYNWYHGSIMAKLRAELSFTYFKGYINLPKLFHLRSNLSELVKNITIETDYFVGALSACQTLILELIMLISITIFLFFIDFKIALYCFLVLFIFSLIIYNLNSKILSRMGRERAKFTQSRLKTIFEGLSGSQIFKASGVKENLFDKFNFYNNKLAKISRVAYFRTSLPKPLFELLVLALITISVFVFLQRGNEIIKTLPILGTFLAAGYRLIPSFGKIMTAIQTYKFAIANGSMLSKVKEKFDLNKNNVDKIKIRELKNKSLKIKNLTFSYEKNISVEKNIIFKNLNVEIKFGQKIGILGESGSGKSTLLDLIMGLIPAEKGRISINGNTIEDIKTQWQTKIGCVPQNVFISDQSLKNNIAFGEDEKDIDFNKIDKSIKISNLDEFKNDLKFGLNTILGENGARISGGQRQRIGIARAMYNNPDILILDEATNALDAKNEKKIIEEIFNNAVNKTIILVSHNKENFKFCDEVYEIENKNLRKLIS